MLETVGYDASTAAAFAPWDAADASAGRVVHVDRGVVSVLTETGPQRVTLGGGLLKKMAHDATEGPCAGDWCVVRSWPDQRLTLEHLLPRRTAVVAPAAGGQPGGHVLCANADLVAAVVALRPAPAPADVERLLGLARASGAQPVVVLSKADLVPDAARVAGEVAALAPGVEVVCVSVRTGEGVDRVRAMIGGRYTMALVGAAGHGRSSLTNALVGAEVLGPREGSVRQELVVLPGGGAVIDTPDEGRTGPLTQGGGSRRSRRQDRRWRSKADETEEDRP